MTIYQRVDLAIQTAVETARAKIPIDTGNLRYNAFKYERVAEDEWRIYIDDEVAPYAIYVNEPWISAKWNGKQNPNQGFWDEVVKSILEDVSNQLNGQIQWR